MDKDNNMMMEDKGNNIALSYGIVHPRKRAFIAAYAETGTIVQAAEIAGIDRQTHYDWSASDPDYVKACQDAYIQSGERLEQEARRRAVQGVQKPVFYKGEKCGAVTEYSDTLLIFLLKGAMPEKYKERNVMDINVQQVQPGDIKSIGELRELFEKQKAEKADLIIDIETSE